jgi:phospholipid/cholesterol/gamma-HCH transport system permease protein
MIQAWRDNRHRVNEIFDDLILSLWKTIFQFFFDCGRACIFFWESVQLVFVKPFRWDELLKHMEFVGNRSVVIIILTSLFTGLALAYQIFLGFKLVNATNLVGPTVGLAITRELGPVLTGLLVAARAGGAMAARLGTMRVSEQIDAMEVMGVDPKQFLVAPRILAALLVMPLLCAIFDFTAMLGAHFLCINVLGLDQAIFWDKIQLWLNPGDIYQGMIKSAVFGLTFGAVCCNKGFHAEGGAKGVGEATNQGVVNSMVLIIIINSFLANFIRFYYVMMGWK